MEDSKKPSLDKVIEKLEGLDIREWQCAKNSYGPRFIVSIGPLSFFVFKWDKHHRITISERSESLFVEYSNAKKDSVEELKICTFYNNLCKKHEGYCKKEFEDALGQIFSD